MDGRDIKRITIFAGHYGSGKTNLAVNYALHLKEKGYPVKIADLDIETARSSLQKTRAGLASPN